MPLCQHVLAGSLAAFVIETVKLDTTKTVLDYGCGTGLLSFLLSEKVKQIKAADTSSGMLDQIRNKLSQTKIRNIEPVIFDIETQPLPNEHYDVIVSSMTLHHLNDVPGAIRKLCQLLKPGGSIVLADLCKEDGSFHTEVKVPHFGFEPEEIERVLNSEGLKNIKTAIAFEITRNNKNYPVFCACAKNKVS